MIFAASPPVDDGVNVARSAAMNGFAKRREIRDFLLTKLFALASGAYHNSFCKQYSLRFGPSRHFAVGHAKLASVRMCFEAITQYAPRTPGVIR